MDYLDLLREFQRLLGSHLRLQTLLVLLVVDTLGVYPGTELSTILWYDSMTKFSLELPEFCEKGNQVNVNSLM